MSDLPTRCDIAANALSTIADGGNFVPLYTSEQALHHATSLLREAGMRMRRADNLMFDQCNQIYALEMALVEARKPWWRKVREKWNP